MLLQYKCELFSLGLFINIAIKGNFQKGKLDAARGAAFKEFDNRHCANRRPAGYYYSVWLCF